MCVITTALLGKHFRSMLCDVLRPMKNRPFPCLVTLGWIGLDCYAACSINRPINVINWDLEKCFTLKSTKLQWWVPVTNGFQHGCNYWLKSGCINL